MPDSPPPSVPPGGTPWLNIVAAVLGIVGFVTTPATQVYIVYLQTSQRISEGQEQLIQTLTLLSALTAGMLLAFSILCYTVANKIATNTRKTSRILFLERKIEQDKNISAEICYNFASIAKEQYEFCSRLYNGEIQSEAEIVASLTSHFDQVLTNISTILTSYTGYTTAVCIKGLTESPTGKALPSSSSLKQPPSPYLRTLRRDLSSRPLRKAVDAIDACSTYKYQENTAFRYIIDLSDKEDYFICNDLQALGDEYENINPNWRKFYNAVAVVPIKMPNFSAHEQCMGMLCADNLHGGFDNSECLHMMEEVATMLYLSVELSIMAIENGA